MPNRLELDLARDAVKAALESPAGKSAVKSLTPVADECQRLLSHLPGGQNLADMGKAVSSEFPPVSSLLAHESNPLRFTGQASGQLSAFHEALVKKVDFRGWSDCVEVKTAQSSAVVVPETGRIASFKLAGGDNVFWENSALSGKSPGAASGNAGEWMNFGGDKVWPAPQSSWPQFMKGDWPPPREFDQMPVKVEVHPDGVTTTSAVNPQFGMRIIRHVSLKDSTMDVTNTFEKVEGKPVEVSVWSVAQMRDPRLLAFPLHKTPTFPDGYATQMGTGIPSLATRSDIATFIRDLKQEHKIGTPSNTILWVGEKSMMRMRAENALADARFPDGGSATEIYTNHQVPYIELETLGPTTRLAEGEKTSHRVQYQLFPTSDFAHDL